MVMLRRAGWRDVWRLYRWRTDPVTARMMIGAPPTIPQHVWWCWRVFRDKRRALYIAYGERPIGTVRLDWRTLAECEISVTVAPEWRSRGYGTAIIDAAVSHVRAALIVCGIETMRVVAYIKAENIASHRAFSRAGFEPVRCPREYACLVKEVAA